MEDISYVNIFMFRQFCDIIRISTLCNRFKLKEQKMNKIQKICGYGFVIITFALLLYRITLHADVDDEIMNLNIVIKHHGVLQLE